LIVNQIYTQRLSYRDISCELPNFDRRVSTMSYSLKLPEKNTYVRRKLTQMTDGGTAAQWMQHFIPFRQIATTFATVCERNISQNGIWVNRLLHHLTCSAAST